MRIVIGEGSCGIAAGAEKVRKALVAQNLKPEISITGCIGMCYLEPIVDLYEDDGTLTRLVKVAEKDAPAIAAYVNDGDRAAIEKLIVTEEDSQFLKKQTRIALRNCGLINPEEIGAYMAVDGYSSLKKAVCDLTPEGVIDIINNANSGIIPDAELGASDVARRISDKKLRKIFLKSKAD